MYSQGSAIELFRARGSLEFELPNQVGEVTAPCCPCSEYVFKLFDRLLLERPMRKNAQNIISGHHADMAVMSAFDPKRTSASVQRVPRL
jgi:hypothetical protein